MSFALLAAALPSVVQYAQAHYNRPKEEDYRANTAGQEKYIAHLRSKTAKSEVAHQALQPQLRAIGQQTRQTERKIKSAVGRGNLSAAEEAQLQISQGQQASSALQVAGETAIAAQTQENRRVGEQVARLESSIAQAKEQADIDFERATRQNNQMKKDAIIGGIGSVASAGLGDFLTKQATSGAAFDAASAAGLGGFESASDLAKASVDAGFTNPQQYVNMLANQQKVQQSFAGFGKDEIATASQELFGTSEFDIGKDLSTGGAQQLLNKLGEGRTNTVMQASQAIANNEITDISQIPTNLSDPMRIQLANQLAAQKASLATDTDKQISGLVHANDKKGLLKIMGQENIDKKDFDAADRGLRQLKNADIKAINDTKKEAAKNAKLAKDSHEKLSKFTTRAIELESKLELDLLNLEGKLKVGGGYPTNDLLTAVGQLKNQTSVSPEDLEGLGSAINKWIESLDLEDTALVGAFGSIEDFGGESGVTKGTSVKRRLKSEYSSLIKQLADQNVFLSPEEQASFNATIDPAGLGL